MFITGQLTPALLPHIYDRLRPRDLVSVSAVSSSADKATVAYDRAAVGESDALVATRCDHVVPSPGGYPPLSNRTIRWLHIPKVCTRTHPTLSGDHPRSPSEHHSPPNQCGSSLAVLVLRYGCRVPSIQTVLSTLPFSLMRDLNVSGAAHRRAASSLIHVHPSRPTISETCRTIASI